MIFDNKQNRVKCQKFTPLEYVDIMLDLTDYKHNLIGRKVLENSFGSGNILKRIVQRYIEDGLSQNLSPEYIVAHMAEDIYGIELDTKLFDACIVDLNTLIEHYDFPPVTWNLHNEDFLKWNRTVRFDFIIGNPPYITYKSIDSDSKKWIKEHFDTCTVGKFDYCYAFIEIGVKLLNEHGKLVQLIPNNIYKNVFAVRLRSLLLPHITDILDYPNQKIFGQTLTSSSIFLFDNGSQIQNIHYHNLTDDYVVEIPRTELTDKWIFSAPEYYQQKLTRFGDIFHVSVAVATLFNEAFVLREDQLSETQIEDAVLRPAAAPKTLRRNVHEYIIFPYKYIDGQLQRYTKEEFEDKCPMAVRHLQKYRAKLDARDSDRNAKWFEYGRSQALAHLNQEKLLMSTVVTNANGLYHLDADTIPYSGFYITVRDDKYTLDDAAKILSSDHFMKYVRKLGISISGRSKRITCRDINNYQFVEE